MSQFATDYGQWPGPFAAASPPPAPTFRPRASLGQVLAGIRDSLVLLAVLAIGAVVAHDHFKPAPPAPPDRVEAAAKAYLLMQPTSLKAVAADVRSGKVKAEGVGEAISAAHLPAAAELAGAIKAAPDLAGALERAAAAMEGGLKK